jgi:hypothetical protein
MRILSGAAKLLQRHGRPLCHQRAPAQQMRVLFPGLDTHHAREVHCHHGGDVGDAEGASGRRFVVCQVGVDR